MKIAMQNAETTRRGWWVHAYRIRGYNDWKPLKIDGRFVQLSLFGLLGFALDTSAGFNLSVGASWLGGCGIGWHPGVDDSPVER